jgi:Subtilase family
MKEGDIGGAAVAPSVFLVNISMADPRRPFSGPISPWARLLDYLAERFNILFLVSAGNISDPLPIAGVSDWTTFERATTAERERFALSALDRVKHERTLLSPAEALNPLTIGAAHDDDVRPRVGSSTAIDPLDGTDLPNLSSALGLGHRKVVKPEIFFPGGREHIRPQVTGAGLVVQINPPQRLYGLRTAAPDTSGLARLDVDALTAGTSAATALATRAAHQIFDALMDREGGSMHADMDSAFYAVVIKALLVHRARWTDKALLLEQLFGPHDIGKHNERRDNISRVLGFGRARIAETIACTANRATLAGYGAVSVGSADAYRIPLPVCLERPHWPRFRHRADRNRPQGRGRDQLQCRI